MPTLPSKQFFALFGALWIGLEITVAALSFVLPHDIYLSAYLTEKAKEKTQAFVNGDGATLSDELLGWRNRPNFENKDWVVDQWGGRHHKTIELRKDQDSHRLIMLGSSLINGSNVVDNQNTISAIFDRFYADYQQLAPQENLPNMESLNFATMLYTLDQIKLQAQRDLLKFKPDTLVIGLHEDPTAGLGNLYIPFRLLDEENMPFMKPRYILNPSQKRANALSLIRPPLDLLQTQDTKMLNFLKQHDDYYRHFTRFTHFHFTPIADAASRAAMKTQNFVGYWQEDQSQFALLRQIMIEFEAWALTHDIQLVYLHLPTTRAVAPSRLWQYIPDYYQARYEWISAPWSQETRRKHPQVQSKGPIVLDVRASLRQSGIAWQSLYAGDDLHFSKQGNDVIAQALLQQFIQSRDDRKTNSREQTNQDKKQINL